MHERNSDICRQKYWTRIEKTPAVLFFLHLSLYSTFIYFSDFFLSRHCCVGAMVNVCVCMEQHFCAYIAACGRVCATLEMTINGANCAKLNVDTAIEFDRFVDAAVEMDKLNTRTHGHMCITKKVNRKNYHFTTHSRGVNVYLRTQTCLHAMSRQTIDFQVLNID